MLLPDYQINVDLLGIIIKTSTCVMVFVHVLTIPRNEFKQDV